MVSQMRKLVEMVANGQIVVGNMTAISSHLLQSSTILSFMERLILGKAFGENSQQSESVLRSIEILMIFSDWPSSRRDAMLDLLLQDVALYERLIFTNIDG